MQKCVCWNKFFVLWIKSDSRVNEKKMGAYVWWKISIPCCVNILLDNFSLRYFFCSALLIRNYMWIIEWWLLSLVCWRRSFKVEIKSECKLKILHIICITLENLYNPSRVWATGILISLNPILGPFAFALLAAWHSCSSPPACEWEIKILSRLLIRFCFVSTHIWWFFTWVRVSFRLAILSWLSRRRTIWVCGWSFLLGGRFSPASTARSPSIHCCLVLDG